MMILDWFDARKAVEVGASLADRFVPHGRVEGRARSRDARPDLRKFLRQAASEVQPLRLNLFKRARLLETFKSRLRDHGLDQSVVEELTRLLLLQCSGNGKGSVAPPSEIPVVGNGGSRRRIPELLTEVDALFAKAEIAEAAERLQDILRIEPDHAFAHNKLGDALCRLGRYSAAELEFRRAIELKADFADANFNLGNVLRWRGDFAESETSLRRAVKKDPRNVDALVGLGHTLSALDRVGDARACFEKALRMKPRMASALCGLGWLASMEGRFGDAEKLYRSALETDPLFSEARASLVNVRRMTAADREWLEETERLLARGVPPLEQATLRFAMGKYFNDLGDYPRAFGQYKQANELRKLLAAPYDRAARSAFVDDMIRVYTRERLARPAQGASDSAKPVFVVGMMRSGTSLVEQIIASHRQAAGAGELEFWTAAIRKPGEPLRRAAPDEPLARKLADSYQQVLVRHSAQASRVVDKAPVNSDFLGPIHCVFPQAHFIYLRRDPVDTCLSCYFQDFANMASFTLDLSDLAHYCREHHRLVAHWRSVLPREMFLEVPYAELVADQEGWSRRIIEFIGLEWDPRVLEFHKTDRAVLTASHWQVRQKIYSSSVGRWKHYEKFIGPLLKLRDLAP